MALTTLASIKMTGTTTLDWVTAVATVLAAVGTIGAVLVALYLNAWRYRRRRPELTLFLRHEGTNRGMGYSSAVLEMMPTGTEEEPEAVTLAVSNARGKRTAENVEVLLTAVWTSDRQPAFSHTQFENRPLPWAYALGESGGAVTQLSLPAGVSRNVEVLRFGPRHWIAPWVTTPAEFMALQEDDPKWTPPFNVFFAIRPFSLNATQGFFDHLLYHLRFLVTANDVDAIAYEAQLRCTINNAGGGLEIGFEWPVFRLGDATESTEQTSYAATRPFVGRA